MTAEGPVELATAGGQGLTKIVRGLCGVVAIVLWCGVGLAVDPAAARAGVPVLGDGEVTEPGACGDGNSIDGDGCSVTCEIEARAGNLLGEDADRAGGEDGLASTRAVVRLFYDFTYTAVQLGKATAIDGDTIVARFKAEIGVHSREGDRDPSFQRRSRSLGRVYTRSVTRTQVPARSLFALAARWTSSIGMAATPKEPTRLESVGV